MFLRERNPSNVHLNEIISVLHEQEVLMKCIGDIKRSLTPTLFSIQIGESLYTCHAVSFFLIFPDFWLNSAN